MTLTQTLPKAWNIFLKNKKYLILIVLLEFFFLFVLAQLHLLFFIPSADASLKAQEAMQKELQKLPDTEIYQLDSVLVQNEEFMQSYRLLIRNIVYFLLSAFATWTFFRAPLWYLAHASIKKVPLGRTIGKFSLLSIFWFIAGLIALFAYSVLTGSTQTVLPIVSSGTTTFLMLVIFIVILYFAQVSFALLPAQQTFKKTFALGTTHAKTIAPAFLINQIIQFVALALPFNWIELAPNLGVETGGLTFVIGILAIMLCITIPALAFARIHLIVATWLKPTSS